MTSCAAVFSFFAFFPSFKDFGLAVGCESAGGMSITEIKDEPIGAKIEGERGIFFGTEVRYGTYP